MGVRVATRRYVHVFDVLSESWRVSAGLSIGLHCGPVAVCVDVECAVDDARYAYGAMDGLNKRVTNQTNTQTLTEEVICSVYTVFRPAFDAINI